MKNTQKIFKLICKSFGHKFSFHAVNLPTEKMLKNEWCNYQSFNATDFSVEETTDTKWKGIREMEPKKWR